MSTIFAERLRHKREEIGLSKSQLAEKADLHRSSINHYEDGVRTPTIDILVKLAGALGVSANWLVGMDEPMDHFITVPVIQYPDVNKPLLHASLRVREECVHVSLGVRFCFIMNDSSMRGARIFENYTVCINMTEQISTGKIALVKHRDHGYLLRRVFMEENRIILHAENSDFDDIIVQTNDEGWSSDLEVIGIMKRYLPSE